LREKKPALSSVEGVRMRGDFKGIFPFLFPPHPDPLPQGEGVFFLNLMAVTHPSQTKPTQG